MNMLQLILAPFGLPFAFAGWWMLSNARKAADWTVDTEMKSPTAKWFPRMTKSHGGETSRRIETLLYKVVGVAFLIGGTAFTIINLLVAFGVLTPTSY